MLLNGRLTVEDMPDPVEIDVVSGDYPAEASEQLGQFFDQGYASSDEEVLDSLVPDKSPRYSVEVLLPEDSMGARNFPEEAYIGDSLEDRARFNGLAEDSEQAIENLEDGYIYLMGVVHASEFGVEPEFRVAEVSLDVELVNRPENLEAMSRVEKVVDELDYDLAFHDYTLWTESHSRPESALEEAQDQEMKLTASMYTDTPFYMDTGYLSSPQEDGSEFGISIRNRASEAVTEKSMQNIREVVQETVAEMEDHGFSFSEEELLMRL